MNKKGHMALGVLAGSTIALAPLPYPEGWMGFASRALVIMVTAIASLLPDADHKTSTVSSKVQFSAKYRKRFRLWGSLGIIIGLLLWIYGGHTLQWKAMQQIEFAGVLVAGSGVLLTLLAHLRTIIFSFIGIGFLYAYQFYNFHWVAALLGAAFLLLPLVKHRGIIHTPEFATTLSLGLLSFSGTEAWWVQALMWGVIVGWWAHLAGDIFGSDGIHSLFAPKIGVALHWFSNGGKVESAIAKICWSTSFILWIVVATTLLRT